MCSDSSDVDGHDRYGPPRFSYCSTTWRRNRCATPTEAFAAGVGRKLTLLRAQAPDGGLPRARLDGTVRIQPVEDHRVHVIRRVQAQDQIGVAVVVGAAKLLADDAEHFIA